MFAFREFKFGCPAKGLPLTSFDFPVPLQRFLDALGGPCEEIMAEYRGITPSAHPGEMSKFLCALQELGYPSLSGMLENPGVCGDFLNKFLGVEAVKLIPGLEVDDITKVDRVINNIESARVDGDNVVLRCGTYERVK